MLVELDKYTDFHSASGGLNDQVGVTEQESMSKISDITLVNLPSPFLEDSMQTYSLGILNMATSIRNSGYSVEVLDLAPIVKDNKLLNLQILHELKKIKSTIVGVSVTTPQSRFLPLFPIAFEVKKLIVGGPHAVADSQEALDYGFHLVISGEGETVIDRTMDGFGLCIANPVKNLDTLPFPDRSFFRGYKGAVPIMASRGCPYKCSFCSTTLSKKVRFRTPENVLEEIKELNIKYPEKDEIIFYDETFTLDYNWLDRLCELIRNSNIKNRFRCSTRADKIPFHVATMLKSAGFEKVCIGVESGSQKILNTLNKRIAVDQNTYARYVCKKAGLKLRAYIMLGAPGETKETMEETYNWIRASEPDEIGLYMYNPLPGSDIWSNKEKYDIEFSKSNYDRAFYGGCRWEMISGVSTSNLTNREITEFYWKVLRDFSDMII